MDLLDLKAQAADRLAKIVPSNWKWSLSIRRPSTIILTIKIASEDFLHGRIDGKEFSGDLVPVNPYLLENIYEGNELMSMNRIVEALAGKGNKRGEVFAIEILLGSVQAPFKRLR